MFFSIEQKLEPASCQYYLRDKIIFICKPDDGINFVTLVEALCGCGFKI